VSTASVNEPGVGSIARRSTRTTWRRGVVREVRDTVAVVPLG
jgi:hypothetical protein